MEDLATLLTPGQVAAKLGVSRAQIDKWLRAGRIPHLVIGGTRYVRPADARKKPAPLPPGPKPSQPEPATKKNPPKKQVDR